MRKLVRLAFKLWAGAKQEWAACQMQHELQDLSPAEIELRAIEQAFRERSRGNLRAAAAGMRSVLTQQELRQAAENGRMPYGQ